MENFVKLSVCTAVALALVACSAKQTAQSENAADKPSASTASQETVIKIGQATRVSLARLPLMKKVASEMAR